MRFVGLHQIRSEACNSCTFFTYVQYFENRTGRKIKRVHTDGGTKFSHAIHVVSEQEVLLLIDSPYTTKSIFQAEITHARILSLERNCLTQVNLPFQCWNYAVRNVSDYMNYFKHNEISLVPHTELLGRPQTSLQHLRSFWCQVIYRRSVKKLGTFQPRLFDAPCIYHELGGIYKFMKAYRVIRK